MFLFTHTVQVEVTQEDDLSSPSLIGRSDFESDPRLKLSQYHGTGIAITDER